MRPRHNHLVHTRYAADLHKSNDLVRPFDFGYSKRLADQGFRNIDQLFRW
jgi:hypothetical protein